MNVNISKVVDLQASILSLVELFSDSCDSRMQLGAIGEKGS